MEQEQIVLVGTGPEARIVIDIFNAQDTVVLGIVSDPSEDKSTDSLNDISVFAAIGSKDAKKVITGSHVHYFITAGEINRRKELYEQMEKVTDRPPANAVHPAAWVSPYAKMGAGNMVNAGAVVNANVFIGNHNFIHSQVSIEPDAIIGDFCTLSSGVKIGGSVKMGNEVFVGTGAVIHPGITIGEKAMIGAGAVVLREVRAGAIVFGNPAAEAQK